MIRLSGVEGTELGRIDHHLLQLVDGSLVYSCPPSLKICLKQCGQRGCDSLEPFDKLLVKSTQPDRLSNLMNRDGFRDSLALAESKPWEPQLGSA